MAKAQTVLLIVPMADSKTPPLDLLARPLRCGTSALRRSFAAAFQTSLGRNQARPYSRQYFPGIIPFCNRLSRQQRGYGLMRNSRSVASWRGAWVLSWVRCLAFQSSAPLSKLLWMNYSPTTPLFRIGTPLSSLPLRASVPGSALIATPTAARKGLPEL